MSEDGVVDTDTKVATVYHPNLGDCVRLKGGTTSMVVKYMARSGASACCIWHDQRGQLNEEWFRSYLLELVT